VMATTLQPDSPCEAVIVPDDKGGIVVKVRVPTYSGGVELVTYVERSGDGDWVIYLPMWPEGDEEPCTAVAPDGDTYDVRAGIALVGAPDVPVEASWS
jgi:hypothetical protein